jgi:hypothetical protein
MANLKKRIEQVGTAKADENARLDAEADREFEAGVAIPLDEAFAWLHDAIDGKDKPKPKARKI